MDGQIEQTHSTYVFSRRSALRGLAVLGAGGLLAACGGGEASPTTAPAAGGTTPAKTDGAAGQPTAAAPAGQTGGTLAVWQVKLFTEAANELSREQITAFAQENGYTAEVSDLPTDFIAKIIPAVEAGDVPDLVQTDSSIAQLQATGGLVDMSETVNELTSANGAPIPLLERAGLIEGKWWGVPWFHYADGWFLRSDILSDAGVEPESLVTFEQRRDAALQISTSSLWGWGLTMKSNTGDGDILARLTLDSWGATMTNEEGTNVIIGTDNKQAAVDAIAWMVDTYTNERFAPMLPPGVMGWTGGSNNEQYLGGQLGMTMNASSVYWAAKNQNSPYYEDTYVAAFPTGPVNELGGGYPYYHVTFNDAEHLEFATQIAKFMGEEAQQIARMEVAEGQSWPAYEQLFDSEAVQNFVQTDPGYAQLLANATHPSGWTIGWPGPMTPAAAAVASQFLQAKAFEAAIAGQVSPEQAVEEMHQAAVDIYNSFGFAQ